MSHILEGAIANREIYLSRLAAPLKEKLNFIKYVPQNPRRILDVGCANGVVTMELARMFPNARVLGIDLDSSFIQDAKDMPNKPSNLDFEAVYLRQLLERPERYDLVTSVSVFHEFESWGEGKSSVVKAVADIHELLNPSGYLGVRDMILPEAMRTATLFVPEVTAKVRAHPELDPFWADHESRFGPVNSQTALNHFLLKYWYQENWGKESQENYVGMTIEDYHKIFEVLEMPIQFQDCYLIPYLRDKWVRDFDLSEAEVGVFRSTGRFIVQKNPH